MTDLDQAALHVLWQLQHSLLAVQERLEEHRDLLHRIEHQVLVNGQVLHPLVERQRFTERAASAAAEARAHLGARIDHLHDRLTAIEHGEDPT